MNLRELFEKVKMVGSELFDKKTAVVEKKQISENNISLVVEEVLDEKVNLYEFYFKKMYAEASPELKSKLDYAKQHKDLTCNSVQEFCKDVAAAAELAEEQSILKKTLI